MTPSSAARPVIVLVMLAWLVLCAWSLWQVSPGAWVKAILVLAWIGLPLWTWWRCPTPAGRALLLLGAGIAAGLSGVPWMPESFAGKLMLSLRHAVVLGGVAAAVHVVLRVPERPFLADTGVAWLYFPVAVFWALMMWRVWSPMAAEHPVVMISRMGGAVLILAYALAALMLMSRQAAREWVERRPSAGWQLLLGLLAGVAPIALAALLSAVWPSVGAPLLAGSPAALSLVALSWSRLAAGTAKPAN